MSEFDGKNRIVDPNRAERVAARWIIPIFCGIGVAMALLVDGYFPVSAVIILISPVISALITANRPYAVLTPEGVAVRFVFRERIYAWSEIPQTGIWRGTAAKAGVEYKYPLIILLPGGSTRKGDWDPLVVDRNLFRVVILPNREEIRDHIRCYYGSFDFDDTGK